MRLLLFITSLTQICWLFHRPFSPERPPPPWSPQRGEWQRPSAEDRSLWSWSRRPSWGRPGRTGIWRPLQASERGLERDIHKIKVSQLGGSSIAGKLMVWHVVSPSNAEATFIQQTSTQSFFWKPSKPYHVGIHWMALTEYSQMSTHVPGFQSYSRFLHHFVLAKLATSSIIIKS